MSHKVLVIIDIQNDITKTLRGVEVVVMLKKKR